MMLLGMFEVVCLGYARFVYIVALVFGHTFRSGLQRNSPQAEKYG